MTRFERGGRGCAKEIERLYEELIFVETHMRALEDRAEAVDDLIRLADGTDEDAPP